MPQSTSSPREQKITLTDEFFTGKDYTLQCTIVDADGDAVNITGWALKWVLVRTPLVAGGMTADVEYTDGSGITITDGPNGILEIAVADNDTDALQGADTALYWHELSRTDAGSEEVLIFGSVVLRQSTTI